MTGRTTGTSNIKPFSFRVVLCPLQEAAISKSFPNLSLFLHTLLILPTITPSAQMKNPLPQSAHLATLFLFSSTPTQPKKPPPSCHPCSATQLTRLFCPCLIIPHLIVVSNFYFSLYSPSLSRRRLFYFLEFCNGKNK